MKENKKRVGDKTEKNFSLMNKVIYINSLSICGVAITGPSPINKLGTELRPTKRKWICVLLPQNLEE